MALGGRLRRAQAGARGDLDTGAGQRLADRHGPRSSSLALVDAPGGSVAGALTLRRHDKPTRSARSRPPAPGSRTPNAGSPVRRASPVVVPGRSPASISACLTHVRRAAGRIPSPFGDPTHRPPRTGPGRPRRPSVNRTARRPCSSGYFPGAGTTPHPFHEFKPSTTPRTIHRDHPAALDGADTRMQP